MTEKKPGEKERRNDYHRDNTKLSMEKLTNVRPGKPQRFGHPGGGASGPQKKKIGRGHLRPGAPADWPFNQKRKRGNLCLSHSRLPQEVRKKTKQGQSPRSNLCLVEEATTLQGKKKREVRERERRKKPPAMPQHRSTAERENSPATSKPSDTDYHCFARKKREKAVRPRLRKTSKKRLNCKESRKRLPRSWGAYLWGGEPPALEKSGCGSPW